MADPTPLIQDPVAQALAALQAVGATTPDDPTTPQGARAQMAPFLAFQQFDPSAPNFQPAPYGQTVAEQQGAPGEIQMPEDQLDQVHHLPPATPQSVPVKPGDPKPAAFDDPSGLAREEQGALDDEYSAKLAENKAQAASEVDQANRLGDVYKKTYDEQKAADADYQTARSLAHRQADLETNQWMQEYQQKAEQEPNPNRWFESKSGFGKALWALSLLAGAANVGWNGGVSPGGGQLHNVALELAQKEIQADIERQKQRLDRELGALKMKGQVLSDREKRNLTDLTDDHSMALGRINALQQEYLARAKAPGKAQNAAADAAVDTWFAQQKVGIAGKKREESVRAKESALQRANEARIAAGHDQTQLDVAAIEAETRRQTAKASAKADTTRISPESGIKVIDKATGKPIGDGALYVSNHMKPEEVATEVTGASQRVADMQTVKDALDAVGRGEEITNTSPELQSALSRLKLDAANGKLARLTDKDMEIMESAMTGGYSGSILGRGIMSVKNAELGKVLQTNIDDTKYQTELKLKPHLPEGATIDWHAVNARAPQVGELSPAEQTAQLGPEGYKVPGAKPPPASPDEYAKAKASGETPKAGRTVQDFRKYSENSTPDHIREMASAALEAVDPWRTKEGNAYDFQVALPAERDQALKIAEKREKDLVDDLVAESKAATATTPLAKPRPPTPDRVKELAATEYHMTNGMDAAYEEKIRKQVEAALNAL